MRLENCGPRVGEADIDGFERRVGVTLPGPYRRFLLEVNGGDGAVDESGYPPDTYFSLHWLGGPVSDADIAASFDDAMGWSDPEFHRDLEFAVRGLWRSGLPRRWLPVGRVNHEDLLLICTADGSVSVMSLIRGYFDEEDCTRVAGSFDELGLQAS